MTTYQLASTPLARDSVNGNFQSLAISLPKFEYEQGRWATSRIQNVDEIADHWKSKPNTVRVLVDPKLKDTPLVLMRKDRFETAQKLLNDFRNGQASVRYSIRTLMNALIAAKSIVDSKRREVGEALEPLEAQLEVILHLSTEIEASFFVKESDFKVEPSPLTLEELASLEGENDDE